MQNMASRSCSLRTKFEQEKGLGQETITCLCSPGNQNDQPSLDTREGIVQEIQRILDDDKKPFRYLRRQSNRFKRPKLSEVCDISSPVTLLTMKTHNGKDFTLFSPRKDCKRKRDDDSGTVH